MRKFIGVERQLMRENNISKIIIREAETYNQCYIGEKKYIVLYIKDGIKHNKLLPPLICQALQHDQVEWETVERIGMIINEVTPIIVPQKKEYKATSGKRNTRKQINKIKVRGYYENM